MGNCLPLPNSTSRKRDPLPIDTMFKLPSPLPSWPTGGNFAKGSIDLGGLEVLQVSTFTKVWAIKEGGQDNLGATFFNPSPIPSGYFMLGSYSQPNNKPLFGWVLVGKNNTEGTLEKPVDYKLLWSSESLATKQDSNGYFWLPIAPEGYKAVGLLVTSSPEKPFIEEIRCVRSDFTDQCENDKYIWGTQQEDGTSGFGVHGLRPATRGTQALGVWVGTFIAQVGRGSVPPLTCLKNKDSNLSSMPNLSQIDALMQAYSPWIYFHDNEAYLPSSVSWFFDNGALLYENGSTNPSRVDSTGSNLPQGGSNDGAYWLDLPIKEGDRERVKKGDLQNSQCYLHVKPMLGATFTDIAIWVFYPFNGPARAKVGLIEVIPLGKIGEHVGDWEHLTMRMSNFSGELWRVYFSEHSSGSWVDASQLEFQGGSNKAVAYASLNGHAFYSKAGVVLGGNEELGIGVRDDTVKGKYRMDTGASFEVVAAEYLGSLISEPPWLNYTREWGPKISYKIDDELKTVEESLRGVLASGLENLVNLLPDEVFEEEGPTGPKIKSNWSLDET